MIYKTSALLSLALCSSLAVAQTSSYETDDGWRFNPEFSIGAGYGMTKLKDGDFDEDEAAKKAFAIVKFNEFIGLEGAYIDFDEAGNDQLSFDPKGATLGLILEAPISQAFSVYAKGGQMWWDGDARLELGPVDVADDYDGDETFWGVGTKIRLAENLDLKIEYERFNFEISRDEIDVLQQEDIDMDVDFASVNLQFTF
ncbi:MAG TPA: outer membrane beta-barrel protein [Cellvibrio sp.]|nr:outer membrane beta-barrel protein [Cellvibrio sp.]